MDEINNGEAQIPTTNEGEVVETQVPTSGDPLDQVNDIEELRSRAKGFRAEAHRAKTKPEPKVQATVQTVNPNYLTKEDMLRISTKEAKTLVSEEIRSNWDQVIDYIPPKHRGAETKEEIARAFEVAYIAFKADNPSKPDNPAADLSTITNAGSGSAPKADAKPTEDDPRFRKPSPPEEWYPKKA